MDLLYTVSVAAATFATYLAYSFWFSPLARLPGPLQARLGLGYLTLRAWKKDVGWTLLEAHRRYGPVVRTGRNSASVADPAAITEIYKHGGAWEKTGFYRYFRGPYENLFSSRNNQAHSALRKVLAPAFTATYLASMESLVEPVLAESIALLDGEIAKADGSTTSQDFSVLLQMVAMDTVGELVYGKAFGFLQAGYDKLGFFKTVDGLNAASAVAGTQPRVGVPLFLWSILEQGCSLNALGRVMKLNAELAVKRVEAIRAAGGDEDERQDMTSKWSVVKGPDGKQLPAREVVEACSTVLLAGTDTTGITMRAMVRHVVGNPSVYEKLLKELDEAAQSGELASGISYADGAKLEYFQACLKETLRMHPAVHFVMPRFVPKEGAVLAGHFFAGGTEVGCSPHVVHHQVAAFGPDAPMFRPERWLEANEQERKVLERNMIAFGAGSRVCVGKHISIMEITKILPVLFHRYKFAFTERSSSSPHQKCGRGVDGRLNDSEPWHVESQWFSPQSDFWVDVSLRAV